jgi:hypothetical protein
MDSATAKRRSTVMSVSGDCLTSFGPDRCCGELAAVTALARDHDVPSGLPALVEQMYQWGQDPLRASRRGIPGRSAARRTSGIRPRHGPP